MKNLKVKIEFLTQRISEFIERRQINLLTIDEVITKLRILSQTRDFISINEFPEGHKIRQKHRRLLSLITLLMKTNRYSTFPPKLQHYRVSPDEICTMAYKQVRESILKELENQASYSITLLKLGFDEADAVPVIHIVCPVPLKLSTLIPEGIFLEIEKENLEYLWMMVQRSKNTLGQ